MTPVTSDTTSDTSATPSTRERILDVALDLFNDKGYESTSLRDIAEALGVTKAAIYYHFPSKEEIFMALHQRLHDSFGDVFRELGDQRPFSLASWAKVLERSVDRVLANRRLLVLHERNRTAFETIHRPDHLQDHEDLDERLRQLTQDAAVPLRDRVRLACAIGALMGGILALIDGMTDADVDDVVRELQAALRDLLKPARSATRR